MLSIAFDRGYALGKQEKDADSSRHNVDSPEPNVDSLDGNVDSLDPKPAEPAENLKPSNSGELESQQTCTQTCTNVCPSRRTIQEERPQIAAMVMQGLLANPKENDYSTLQDTNHIEFNPEYALAYADALIPTHLSMSVRKEEINEKANS